MLKLQDLCVKYDDTLMHALKMIDVNGEGIVFVQKDKIFHGTLTDGDIRRGLLRGLTTKDKVNSVINTKPVTINSKTNSIQIKKIMLIKGIRQVPLLNNKGQVIDLRIWNKSDLIEEKDTEIAFMVGGKGRRLMPLTKSTPKPMLKVKGKPILEQLVRKAKNEGFSTLIFITNHLENLIENYFKSGSKWGVRIKYFSEKNPLGTAGGLRFIKKKHNKPVIVSNGDVITGVNFNNLLDFHKKQNNEVTIAVKKFEVENPYGVVRMSQQKVVDLVEKPISKSYVSAGIYVFNSALFGEIKKNENLDMTSFINRLLKKKTKIAACPLHERWIDVGRHDDYKKVNK